jgi:hypothetical protein
LADGLGGGVAEHPLRGGVEGLDQAGLVDDDHPLAHQELLGLQAADLVPEPFGERGRGRGLLLLAFAGGPPADHGFEGVGDLQEDVDGVLVEGQLPATQAVQQVLGEVGQLGDAGELQHRRGALQGVDGPEQLVEPLGLAGVFLQGEEGAVGRLKVFAGVVQVVAQEHRQVGEALVRHGCCSPLRSSR